MPSPPLSCSLLPLQSEPGVNWFRVDPQANSSALTWLRGAVASARLQGADVVVLSSHWCV